MVLEPVVLPPLHLAAPGTPLHRVLQPAVAAAAAPLVFESLGPLQRLGARVAVGDVTPAPRAPREAVGNDPAAIPALGAGLELCVAPHQLLAAVGTVEPEALQLGAAARAAQLRPRDLATLARDQAAHRRPGVAHRRIASSTRRWMNFW